MDSTLPKDVQVIFYSVGIEQTPPPMIILLTLINACTDFLKNFL